MNLSNGYCGPDGCEVLGTRDFGRAQFVTVVSSSAVVAMLGCAAFFAWTLKWATS
jgi:hypothetical protein